MPEPSPPQFRCPDCKSRSSNPRNLVVFIDGTSNKPGLEETNVVKLKNATRDDVNGPQAGLEQRIDYRKGIGAHEHDDLPLSTIARKTIYGVFEMAFAWNVESNIKRAYRWLADNYQEGDQIYLFGFSRGAYQVRALAGMIHEVGLVKKTGPGTETETETETERNKKRKKQIDKAYCRYHSIDRNNPTTQELAVKFKVKFSQEGVRIHFLGVWDTVSSLGLAKQYVQVTASASVTNACHFRHALALDERRVKFMPEYFLEINPHLGDIESPRSTVGDVKEFWFAGCHSDVGGTSRPKPPNQHRIAHAGNVSLLWMRREAALQGLAFNSEEPSWYPEDVDLGRVDSMKWLWKIFEIMRIRHQVSFSGTGIRKPRVHWFRPRPVIPGQQIHVSVSPDNVYTPRATLAHGIDIPTVSQKASGRLPSTELVAEEETNALDGLQPTELVVEQETGASDGLQPTERVIEEERGASDGPQATEHVGENEMEPSCELWPIELVDEEETARLLVSLLSNQQKTLHSLGEVLLLSLRLDNRQTISTPELSKKSTSELSGLDESAITVIREVVSDSCTLEERESAMDVLSNILRFHDTPESPESPDFPRALYVLCFAARHKALRRLFINDKVIEALMVALEQTTKSRNKDIFPLVTDSLCYLVGDERYRNNVVDQLFANGTNPEKTRLLLTLGTKAPRHLMASLKLIASVAEHVPDRCNELRLGIINLATKGRGPVGSAAVEALVKLERGPYNIHFSNVLGYLSNNLPRLDAEIGSASSLREIVDLPLVLKVNDSRTLDEKVMDKLVLTIESKDAHQRTAATLTLLKLCNNTIIRNFCSRKLVPDIFMKQMESKKTSLLAAYAMMTCLRHHMWTVDDFLRVAELVVGMVDKGWFDDAVGRVEGSQILRELMNSGDLRQKVATRGIFDTLTRKLETGDCRQTRISLVCLEILGGYDSKVLEVIVSARLTLLQDKKLERQKRSIKILSALAQTKTGEQAIQPRLAEIAGMLLSPDGSPLPCHKLFGPAATLYNLCKNETLHQQFKQLPEYETFKNLRGDPALYPKTSYILCKPR